MLHVSYIFIEEFWQSSAVHFLFSTQVFFYQSDLHILRRLWSFNAYSLWYCHRTSNADLNNTGTKERGLCRMELPLTVDLAP